MAQQWASSANEAATLLPALASSVREFGGLERALRKNLGVGGSLLPCLR